MTYKRGAPAPNRRLPPDDILQAEMAAGLNDYAIAEKYGLVRQTVTAHINKHGWRKARRAAEEQAKAEARAAAQRRYPCDTAAKVVRKRETLVFFGKKMRVEEHFISLPRVPCIHGHFQGASA
jgi:hypothetical protein